MITLYFTVIILYNMTENLQKNFFIIIAIYVYVFTLRYSENCFIYPFLVSYTMSEVS